MTTNEIEKQLKLKAEKQIHQCVADVVDKIRGFGNTHTGVNRSGMHWYSKRQKPHKKYTSDPEPEDPYVTFDWDELQQLVERKAKDLLNKIDLLG